MKMEKLIDTSGLSPETAGWVRSVLRTWVLEPHHIKLLLLAAQHWDRAQNARREIEKNGPTFTDRFGSPKSKPEVQIERDSSVCFARLLRELALDVELPESPRPAGFIGKGKK
jgi:phage terminase small subunit